MLCDDSSVYIRQGGLVQAEIHVDGADIAHLISALARAEQNTIRRLLMERP